MNLHFDRIDVDAIPSGFILNAGFEKFAYWPVQFNLDTYHRKRLKIAGKDQITLIAAYSSYKIHGIFEISFNAYDSIFFGFKSYSISNIFIPEEINFNDKQFLISQFYSFLRSYLKEQNAKFCSISINSWDTVTSAEAQQAGFRYIVTWGDCFYSKASQTRLPDGYHLGLDKTAQDLAPIVEMTKKYFKGGRFYSDPMFKTYNINKMYEDLIVNSYNDPDSRFSVLYNSNNTPMGCFIFKNILFDDVHVAALRFLVYNQAYSVKGLSTKFLIETSDNLLRSALVVSSGIELHNLASLKIHTDAGYKFNNIHAAYHLWL